MLRKQVIAKPAAPLTVASITDDDDVADAAADDGGSADELPPGIDVQPGSEADLPSSDAKSKVRIYAVCIH